MPEPKRASQDELDSEFDTSGRPKGKLGIKIPSSGGMMQWIITALLIFGISWLMVTYVGVTKADFNKNIALMLAADSSVKSDVKATKDSITASVAGIPGTVTTQVNNAVASINSRLSGLESSLNTANTQATSAVTKATEATNQISGVTKSVTELTSSIASLNTKITDLQTLVNTSKSDIATLKTDLAALKTKVDGVPGGGGTTTPTSGVTAAIVGNVFTGSIAMNFTSIPAGSSQTATLAFNVDNQSGKVLSAIQLACAILTTDTLGNQLVLPSTVVISITSNNFSMVWTPQDTGIGYMKGFATSAVAGFPGMFGNPTVNKGITSYTHTITVTNSGTVASSPMILNPMIKVASFTTQ